MEPIQEYVPVTKAKAMLLDMVRKMKDSDYTHSNHKERGA